MNDTRQPWLVILTTRDHAGDTAAIASVFSGRGLQIDSFIGFGDFTGSKGNREGKIMLTFRAFAYRCQSLCRVLESLEAVSTVHCYAVAQPPDDLLTHCQALKDILSGL